MNEPTTVKVELSDGGVAECLIEFPEEPMWAIWVTGLKYKQHEFAGRDLFDSLSLMRRELEGMGLKLLCAGARPDVFPSGMSRSMGGGRKAYITTLGKPAGDVMIDIFDYAEPDAVGGVEQQIQFHRRWVDLLRQL